MKDAQLRGRWCQAEQARGLPTPAVAAGDRVEFVQIEPGLFLFVAVNRSVTELKGKFGKPAKTASIADMNRAIATRGASAR